MMSPGTFFTGANYWASHAGTAMWSNWSREAVEGDFRRLSEAGIRVLRVFPLWPDFQPIHLLRTYQGKPAEFRLGEEELGSDEAGKAGVNRTAIAHFAEFAELAEQYGMKLIVGLITGWMSGRLFVPPALEGRNVLTDPLAIMWEVRFVKYFVSRFKDSPAIAAWDLGNECNCMAEVSSPEEAWNWTAAITNAIKRVDASRPVVSGMHSLLPDGDWTIQDQAEVTDVLTTHPYPYFTPHCDQDAIHTIRTGLHAVAETLLYRGVGNKPCFVEEMGTLGPMFASDEVGADFVRNNLFTQWAHDCRGFLWWCANDQTHLTHPPYDWYAAERELGYFRQDGSPKPVLREVSKFTRFVDSFPFGALPERIVDAVCIVSKGQDMWGAAYSSFVLAKQAGLDIEYQYSAQPIKDAKLYLVPSLKGDAAFSNSRLAELLDKVKSGAILYISSDNGLFGSFTEYSGLKVVTREKRQAADIMTLDGIDGPVSLPLAGTYRFNLEAVNAEVIGADQDGMPAFTCASYGQGKVFFLNYPVETYLLNKPGVFHGKGALPYWMFYRYLRQALPSGKAIQKDEPNVGVTEHPVDERKRIVVAINYEPADHRAALALAPEWKITDHLYGGSDPAPERTGRIELAIGHNDAVVFVIEQA